MEKTFTPEHLNYFKAYERVRQSGLFNMFDPRARHMTGLDGDAYHFVMDNYAELREAAAGATTRIEE